MAIEVASDIFKSFDTLISLLWYYDTTIPVFVKGNSSKKVKKFGRRAN